MDTTENTETKLAVERSDSTDSGIFIDEVRRVHEQFDTLSGRISRLEERTRGVFGDPMQEVMVWVAIAYAVSLLLPPLVAMWKGAQCSQSS